MDSAEFRRLLMHRASAMGAQLTDDTAALLQQYFDLLARWNRTINLTSLPLIGNPQEAIERLLIEPLAVARHIANTPIKWIDLGSGGGSPAIPLKLYRPELRLTMVESRTRKAAFLREAVRALRLDAVVENLRIEDLAERRALRGSVDLITLRGVRIDAALLGLCRRLSTERGRLVVFGADGLLPGSGFSPTAVPWFFQRCST